MRVHTGRGEDTFHHKHWGRRAYVWNDDGDTAWLRDREGDVRDTCSWPDGDGDLVC